MKDMRDMVEAAPGMVAQAQQLSAQAQQMAAAQQAAYQAQAAQAFGAQPGGFAEGADFDPIAGVSIEQFASVSKGVAAFGYDPARLPEIAALWRYAPRLSPGCAPVTCARTAQEPGRLACREPSLGTVAAGHASKQP
jgi:hypothetical protein